MAITLPHTITAGTLADATQVQGNFDELAAKAVDKSGDTLTGTLNTRALIPTTTNAYDLGSTSLKFKDLYLTGTIIGSAINQFGTIAVSGQSNVVADQSNDTLTLVAGTGITITTNASTDTVTLTFNGVVPIGSSVIFGKVGGTLHNYQSASGVGNVGSGEDTLYAVNIAASVLATDGDAIEFRAAGTFASNANTKRIRVRYGSTLVFDLGGSLSPNGTTWHMAGTITRLSATSQLCELSLKGNGLSEGAVTVASETLSGVTSFFITGEATTDNDIVLKYARLSNSPDSPNN